MLLVRNGKDSVDELRWGGYEISENMTILREQLIATISSAS